MWKVLAFTAVLCVSAFAAEYPKPVGYVNDFAGVLSAEQVNSMSAKLKALEDESKIKSQVVAVLPKDLGGDTVEKYASGLFHEWGIGQKGKDNGVLIVIAPNERKIRIEVGYGFEGSLPDSKAAAIIAKMVVFTRNNRNDWAGALNVAVDEMTSLLNAEKVTETPAERSNFPLWLIIIFCGLSLLLFFGIWRLKRMADDDAEALEAAVASSNARNQQAAAKVDVAGGHHHDHPYYAAALGAGAGYLAGSATRKRSEESSHTSRSRDSDSSPSWSSGGSDSSGGGSFSGGGGDSGGGGASGDA